MKIKKILSLILLIGSVTVVNAQMLSPEVIAAGGDYFESSIGSLSWTLGEPVVETVENGTIQLILTQGFQQPENPEDTVGINDFFASNVFVNLYPNPAVQTVRMEIKYENTSDLKIELIDMWGRVLHSDDLFVIQNNLSKYKLDVSSLASGMYLFKVTEKGRLLNSYKFQKLGS